MPPRITKSLVRPTTREHTLVVERAEVAGAHPAVVGVERGVALGVVVVAEACDRPLAGADTGSSAGGDVGAGVGIEQPHAHRLDHVTGGGEPHQVGVARRGGTQRAGLVAAVELQHVRTGGAFPELGPLGRHHLAPGEHHAERADVVLCELGGVQHHHELRRHRGQYGHMVLFDRTDRCGRVEARQKHAGRAEDRRCEVRGPEPEAERCRKQTHEDVVGA